MSENVPTATFAAPEARVTRQDGGTELGILIHRAVQVPFTVDPSPNSQEVSGPISRHRRRLDECPTDVLLLWFRAGQRGLPGHDQMSGTRFGVHLTNAEGSHLYPEVASIIPACRAIGELLVEHGIVVSEDNWAVVQAGLGTLDLSK